MLVRHVHTPLTEHIVNTLLLQLKSVQFIRDDGVYATTMQPNICH
jgi:hypothetical protein